MISKEKAKEYYNIIEKELIDTMSKEATPNWAVTVKSLLKSMDYLKYMAGEWVDKEYEGKPKNIPDTMIDDRIMDMYSEFEDFIKYKKSYELTSDENDKKMMLDELRHMMINLFEFVKELWQNSNCEEERTMILNKMKETYAELK